MPQQPAQRYPSVPAPLAWSSFTVGRTRKGNKQWPRPDPMRMVIWIQLGSYHCLWNRRSCDGLSGIYAGEPSGLE